MLTERCSPLNAGIEVAKTAKGSLPGWTITVTSAVDWCPAESVTISW